MVSELVRQCRQKHAQAFVYSSPYYDNAEGHQDDRTTFLVELFGGLYRWKFTKHAGLLFLLVRNPV